jgi:DNA-directed RNA polymerase subunit RPC12/RpoP
MPSATAHQKFHCPACGAEAVWTPAKQALICPYCGTTSPAQVELTATGEQIIQEHDLAAALRRIPDDKRGWQAQKTSVRCQSCQAISVFDAERVGQRCDFCGSSSLVPYEEIKEAFRPESLLPMQLAEARVREEIRQWYGSHFWAPNKLKTRALTDQVHGLYIPYWTFDAQVHADWTAESGDYYWDTESYTDAQGRRQTRRVRKIRWYPSSGSLDHFFNDELVAASRGVDAALLRKVEPFPTDALQPYQPGFLSGWVVERYQIDLLAAAQHARAQMDTQLRAMCAAQVPGDTHRNLAVDADYSGQTFKHILVPLWLLTYDYGRRKYQVVINGSTGAIAGKYPLSWVKIFLAVLLALAGVAVVALLAGR